jgi:hypothetical protein
MQLRVRSSLSAALPRTPLVFALAAGLAAGLRADIVITEIHYAPVDASGNPRGDLEFVELFNDGPEPYDLYLYRFTEGIAFEFTERTFLAGRSYLVVSKNRAAVEAEYGITSAYGDFGGQLDNAGEDLALANPQGIVVCRVPYNDRGRWPAGAKGTGHSLSILTPYSDPSDAESWALSARRGGTPGTANFGTEATYQDTVLIEAGEVWRYFKGTQEASSPASAWRQPGFDDAAWPSGPTGIGYGDGDDATILLDMRNGYMTIFCRKTFDVADVSRVEDLVLGITYDDGFYAYLNGALVASRNVTSPAFDAEAPDANEPVSQDIDITAFKGNLVDGSNVLAVQVHNAGISSSDLTFIPRLLSRRVLLPEERETVPVVINEASTRVGDGQRFIELYNTSPSAVDLAGYWLTDNFGDLEKHEIEPPAVIPGRGFLTFTEAALGFDLSIVPGLKDRVSIALTNPAGAMVVDAVIFEPAADGKSEARIPDGGKRFAAAADPTPGAVNEVTLEGDVIFNEIFYHSPGGSDLDEFLELHNRSSSPVDVGGWHVEGVRLTIPEGTTIAAGGYLVLCADPVRMANVHGLAPPLLLTTPWTGSLRNAGERLELLDTNGNLVDTVRYRDGGEWPIWADGGGSSLELIDPGSDNDVAGSWDASDDSAKATTQTITYGPVPYGGGESDFGMMLAEEGIAIIDDIALQPAAGGANLIPNGTFDSNTTPWRIEGTHIRSGRTTDPAERITGAGSLKLIAWNGGGDYKVNRIELDTASQSTGGPFIVSYKARWVVGSPRVITIGDYNVTQPHNAGIAGSREIPYPRDLGTPGAMNSVTERRIAETGSHNVGPAIDDVSHAPGVPEDDEDVTVTARVRDPDGVASVRLFYRTETPAGGFTQVSMTGPDADRRYTGTIPGQPLGTRVIFHLEAVDGDGARARFPADIFSRTHPPVLDPESSPATAAHQCMYRHDVRAVATTRHSYRFVLSQPDADYLRTRRTHSNEMVNGTFVFGTGDVYYNAQVRFSGSPWLRSGGTFDNSYSLKMPKDRPLHGRKLAFNLEEHGNDGRERLSHYLLRLNAGSTLLPYFDSHALVRFRLNDVQDGTYEALDKPNRQYISFWFPDADRGPHFEMDDRFSFNDSGNRTGNADARALYPPYGASSGGGDRENYRWFFNPRSNASHDDFLPLQFLSNVLDPRTTPNNVFDDQAFNVMDVEEMLRTWAIELNIDDWDTWGARRGKNCYLYRSQADGLWRLIPWDLELTYGDVNAFAMPPTIGSTYASGFAEVTRLLNRPRIKRLYYGILADMVDSTGGFFHSGFLGPYMQQLAAAGVGNTGHGQSGGFIDTRAGMIRGWIRSAVYPQTRLAITTNGGEPLTTVGDSVDLAGDAPVDVFHIAVSRNGLFLDPAPEPRFSTSSAFGWAIDDIPLIPGTNVIEVLGLDSRGNIVDRDTIDVSSGTEWGRPVITAVAPQAAAAEQEIVITGRDLHSGLRVYFDGSIQATSVAFDEAVDATRAAVVVPPGLATGETTLLVENLDGQQSAPADFTVLEPTARAFLRGDANLDGSADLSDAVKTLLFLFSGAEAGCRDAMDIDDSGAVTITDPIRLLDYLFSAGPAPSSPFPTKGPDPTTADPLDCREGN